MYICTYTELCPFIKQRNSGEHFIATKLQMCYFLVFLVFNKEGCVILIFVTKLYEQDLQA